MVASVLGLVQVKLTTVMASELKWVVRLVELLALGCVLVFLVGLSMSLALTLTAGKLSPMFGVQ